MKFCEAFDTTLSHYNLSAKEIAEASGMRPATISEYRRGLREIHTNNLERLIQALPPEAQEHFFMSCLIGEMSTSTMATMLHMIAAKMRQGVELRSIDDRIPA
jgi:transcriptional regulator with XRE-family HTH domain